MTGVARSGGIGVLLVEDHQLVRSGLRTLLESCADIEVVAEAGDAHEALDCAAEKQPDVALVDIRMPGMDGLQLTSHLVGPDYGVRVVILSMYGDDAYVLRALQNGASGFLLKTAGPGELELAVRAAARGDSFLCPSIARRMITAFLHGRHGGRRDSEGRQPLTERQCEVLAQVAQGRTSKEIARALGLSVKTIEAHRTEIMRRLGVHGMAGLVQAAVKMGLASADD